MMAWKPLHPLGALAALATGAVSQDLTLLHRDGRLLRAPATYSGTGAGARWRLQTAAGETILGRDEILCVHGEALREPVGDAVRLVGGTVFRGRVREGDRDGEDFELESAVLGTLRVPVDRLHSVVFAAGAVPRTLPVPAGLEQGEVLFLAAARGSLDALTGTLHRFQRRGLHFAEGDREPRTFPYRDLVGFALIDGLPPDEEPTAVLLSRTGDRIHGRLIALSRETCTFRAEGRDLRIPTGEVAAIALLAGPFRWLSDLQPVQVRERSAGAPQDPPLYPYRTDRAATGGILVAGARAHPKGIGVHSKSVLTWRVPAGVVGFHAQVGFDDSIRSLRPRPGVDLQVRLDDQVLFERKGFRGGNEPINLGVLPVTAGALLVLEVDYGTGADLADRIDWLSAVFLPGPGR